MGNQIKKLRDQFHDPELEAELAALQRCDRRKRRMNLIVATAICRAHVAAHGTPCEVNLTRKGKGKSRRVVTTTVITTTVDEMFD